MPDPSISAPIGIIQHMNDDHADSLLAFCRVLAGRTDTVWTSLARQAAPALAA